MWSDPCRTRRRPSGRPDEDHGRAGPSGTASPTGARFPVCFDPTGLQVPPACLAAYDFDAEGHADGVIDWADFDGFEACFSGPGVEPSGGVGHDWEPDGDVDLADVAGFQLCFDPTGSQVPPDCLAVFDFDADGQSDGVIDLNDLAGLVSRLRGPEVPAGGGCPLIGAGCGPWPARAGLAGQSGPAARGTPPSGTFALHGRPVDVLSDGHVLFHFRARYYDPVLGRWLQRDPLPYGDGPNLYEAFTSNATRFFDPLGLQSEDRGVLGTLLEWFARLQEGRHPVTGEDWVTLTLRREGVDVGLDPVRAGLLREYDRYGVAADAVAEAMEPVVARGVGALQVVGGATESTVGGVLVFGTDGLGAAPGTVFVLHGVDVTQAGVRQVWTGEFTFTETYRVIAEAGYPTAALVVDSGISLSSGFAGLGLAVEGVALRAPSTAGLGVSPQALRLQANIARGELGEINALALQRSLGETIVNTQFRQGAVLRGFESVSALEAPGGLRVFVTDVKAIAGNVAPSRLSAFGLNDPATFRLNLLRAQGAVAEQVTDLPLQRAILQALEERTFTVRILGPQGIRVSPSTVSRLQTVTGASEIEIVDMLVVP
ncbi:MAG TPA: RHS repeat-associated core domain-containing protein [Phycisphaerae bacterium]|nr:RHS repeat-associated core domain-containing protein [Phycisphaerae bacterium]